MQTVFKKVIVSLFAVMLLSVPLSAMAATEDFVYDSYDRGDIDPAGSDSNAAWASGIGVVDNNALKLEYGSEGWFGTGGAIDVSDYKYLKLTIKGAAGGEGADFDLNYDSGGVKNTGKSFAELTAASGDPAITTDYQDVYIDLAANGIDSGIQGFHFNFHSGVSGTIWIDQIAFTESAPGAATVDAPAASDDVANPKTGVDSNMNMYLIIALFAGAAAAILWKKGRAQRS